MRNQIRIRFVPKKKSPGYWERDQNFFFEDYGSQNLDFLPSHTIPLLSLGASNPSLSLSLSLSLVIPFLPLRKRRTIRVMTDNTQYPDRNSQLLDNRL
jgi:hypothetical protein